MVLGFLLYHQKWLIRHLVTALSEKIIRLRHRDTFRTNPYDQNLETADNKKV